DGIRDFHVTGVQTCALPIFADTLVIPIRIEDRLGERLPSELETNLYFCAAELLTNVVKHSEASCAEVHLYEPHAGIARLSVHDRSEERRVGKRVEVASRRWY